jgi:hypothetical protein
LRGLQKGISDGESNPKALYGLQGKDRQGVHGAMTAVEIAGQFKGKACHGCGGKKGERKAFCWPCWDRLPAELKPGLYRTFGDGFEAAYEAALAHFKEAGKECLIA